MSSKSVSVESFEVLDEESRAICRPLSFDLLFGEIKILTGANGLGKSTLLQAISNPKDPNLKNRFRGTIVKSNPASKSRFHPQTSALPFALPISLSDVLLWTGTSSPGAWLDGIDLSRKWNSSSGGEKQRILLASIFNSQDVNQTRTFGNEILLLDEPTNHLDKKMRNSLLTEIENWISTAPKRRAALVVTHDLLLFQKFNQVEMATA